MLLLLMLPPLPLLSLHLPQLFLTLALFFIHPKGILLPWDKSRLSNPTFIGDRYMFGGTSSIRGFSHRQVGPCEERPLNAKEGAGTKQYSWVGGDAFMLFTAAVSSILFLRTDAIPNI